MDTGDVGLSTLGATSFHSFIPFYTIRVVEKYQFKALSSCKITCKSWTRFPLQKHYLLEVATYNVKPQMSPNVSIWYIHSAIELELELELELIYFT